MKSELSSRGMRQTTKRSPQGSRIPQPPPLSKGEMRAARAERIVISVDENGSNNGWIAKSEAVIDEQYLLRVNPETGKLTCTCPDYKYRGGIVNPSLECKHQGALLKWLGRRWVETHLLIPLRWPWQTPNGGDGGGGNSNNSSSVGAVAAGTQALTITTTTPLLN